LNCRTGGVGMLTYLPANLSQWANLGKESRDFPRMTKKSPTVLVVDDEALIRWSLSEGLSDAGYMVTEAGDARMALAAVSAALEPFDVVLLDYRLPDSADLKLLEKIRVAAPSTQVIMITAHNSPELSQKAIDLGAFRVVSKPFEVDKIARLVGQAHARGSRQA
jgi:two-component system, NtrC family, response regulator AtoC